MASGQGKNYPNAQNTQNTPDNTANSTKPKRSMTPYIIIGIILVLIVVLGYFAFLAPSAPSNPNQNILSNLTNKSLTSAQHLYYEDLAKAADISALSISYSTGGNVSQPITGPNNTKLIVTANQKINSETMGNNSTSTLYAAVTYHNAANNALLISNDSNIYFYDTPQNTVTCLNQTTYEAGTSSANLTCTYGDGGLYYLDSFPFVITNVTALGYLGPADVTYLGTKTIIGRTCDNFMISNQTGGLISNYTTVSTCLDTQYGIPLYFNETDFSGGLPSQGMLLVVQNISTNVSGQAFVIPPAYISNANNASSII
jgi:hypothetical protein